jgi:hypothetical protein
MEDEFNTLPLIPSPQGRGDLGYLVPKAFEIIISAFQIMHPVNLFHYSFYFIYVK